MVGSAVVDDMDVGIGAVHGWPPRSKNWPENPAPVAGFTLAPGAEAQIVVGLNRDDEDHSGSVEGLIIEYIDGGGAERFQQSLGEFGIGAGGEAGKAFCGESFADE